MINQHPVFPWILADYTSSSLNLEKPETFRKLALPMGAQTESRKRDFIERYLSLEEFGAIGDERMKPAHYMTHYSSAVVRTFWSMHRAWLSASEQSRSDVRELTPEFYHCPEFLKNLNNLSLGSRQEGGDPVGDVQLPPWAHGDPRLFVELHREALESDFVSENIHKWIDLIFGYKQRGQAALDAVNVFQEVSYEGTVSLDAIDDERERSSVLGAMCNWGKTRIRA
ncbi:BEACH domain-containing protein [Phakopsora pachyrhizi]|uniref:BEACH domain-containing protein n=1 Tax=Phakopsora pachyrhizi TaxID=170000 RepID=A0AAV0B1W1_PHAPC|nr:BEACH domain-containing protein [Phakopsora pachyrhizi]